MRIRDCSSDVCSSDLGKCIDSPERHGENSRQGEVPEFLQWAGSVEFCRFELQRIDRHDPGIEAEQDRKRVVKGESVSVRVDLGVRRILVQNTISEYYKLDL